jgi:hypothetical protein
MKKLLLAMGAIGALMLTASPAAAQRHHRGHTSFSVTIGNGYGYSPYGYSPYGYGYAPYSYGYSPYDYGYYDSGYAYPAYYSSRGRYYDRYDRRGYRDRRHRHDRRYGRYYRDGRY